MHRKAFQRLVLCKVCVQEDFYNTSLLADSSKFMSFMLLCISGLSNLDDGIGCVVEDFMLPSLLFRDHICALENLAKEFIFHDSSALNRSFM